LPIEAGEWRSTAGGSGSDETTDFRRRRERVRHSGGWIVALGHKRSAYLDGVHRIGHIARRRGSEAPAGRALQRILKDISTRRWHVERIFQGKKAGSAGRDGVIKLTRPAVWFALMFVK